MLTRPSPSKPLILLVDDNPQNLQVLATNLADDYDIAFATSGQQALDMVRDRPPDLILLDVMMPGMDGFEVCRTLRKASISATIPVIFLTARTDVDDIVRGFEVGGNDYVTKPFRSAELRARVKTHLQLHQLKGFLSICSGCNKIRNERNEWEPVTGYIHRQTGTSFSHGYCPVCAKKIMQDIDEQFQAGDKPS